MRKLPLKTCPSELEFRTRRLQISHQLQEHCKHCGKNMNLALGKENQLKIPLPQTGEGEMHLF